MTGKWWTLAAVAPRRLHAAPRHHDRERRAARHRALARRRALRPAVGDRRLCALARRVPAHRRLDRRPRRPPRPSSPPASSSSRSARCCAGWPATRPRSRSPASSRASAARSCSRPRSRCSRPATAGPTAASPSASSARSPASRSPLGPVLGGAITSGLSWRWIFFVNLPVGIVALLVTLRAVPETRDPHPRRLDWIGFVTFSAGLALLVFGLIRSNEAGWGSAQVLGSLAASVILLLGVRDRRDAAARADVRPVAVPRPDVHRRPGRGVRHLRVAVLAAHVPRDLHAEPARLLGDRDRRALPAAVARDLLHRRRSPGGSRRGSRRGC